MLKAQLLKKKAKNKISCMWKQNPRSSQGNQPTAATNLVTYIVVMINHPRADHAYSCLTFTSDFDV
jgi:hypothetical protein